LPRPTATGEKLALPRRRLYRQRMRAFLARLRPFAPLTLRLAVAAIFIVYGSDTLLHRMSTFHQQVATWGLPRWAGHALAWSAFAGGVLVAIGFLTRLAALALTVAAAVFLVKTRLHSSFVGGLDLPLLELAACISLVLSGAGRFSFDRRFFGGE
jgi:uncharacterized membrane protein YphA (DoxX/SURF4 family)